jgi:hypothetical protein
MVMEAVALKVRQEDDEAAKKAELDAAKRKFKDNAQSELGQYQ